MNKEIPKGFKLDITDPMQREAVMAEQKKETEEQLQRNEQLAQFHGLNTETVSGMTPQERSILRAQMLDKQAASDQKVIELDEGDVELIEEEDENPPARLAA